MRSTWESLLAGGDVLLADGGMGTTLFAMGLARGVAPEVWNIEHPERVQAIHRDYLAAGAQIILTNSFGGNAVRLERHGQAGRVDEFNRAAATLAGAAAAAHDAPAVVGGSIGPTGKLLEPLGDLTFEQATAAFEAQARALLEGGVDVLWIETMSDLQEVRAAVEACHRTSAEAPLVVTMTFDTHGHTSMGVSPQAAAEALADGGLAAMGANCGNGPQEIEAVIAELHAALPEHVLVAKSNAGVPRLKQGQVVYEASPETMAAHAVRVRELGARIIGACCGSTPQHIRNMGAALP